MQITRISIFFFILQDYADEDQGFVPNKRDEGNERMVEGESSETGQSERSIELEETSESESVSLISLK